MFGGKELVDWLLMVGLAHDRTDAVKYGRQLLQGGIIRHIDNLHHFHDQALFYTFRFNEGAIHWWHQVLHTPANTILLKGQK